MGSVPVHWPRSITSVLPARGVPLMIGGCTLSGGSGGAGVEEAAWTGALAADAAADVPPGPDAVTTTAIVWPASAAVAVYMRSVAPGMSSHACPLASQRRHWRVNVIGSVPLQPPSSTASVSPARGVPVTRGALVPAGGSAPIGCVAADSTVFVPASSVAVTRTRSTAFASSLVAVYVGSVAPAMSVHAAPVAQRSHCHARRIGSVPVQSPACAVS